MSFFFNSQAGRFLVEKPEDKKIVKINKRVPRQYAFSAQAIPTCCSQLLAYRCIGIRAVEDEGNQQKKALGWLSALRSPWHAISSVKKQQHWFFGNAVWCPCTVLSTLEWSQWRWRAARAASRRCDSRGVPAAAAAHFIILSPTVLITRVLKVVFCSRCTPCFFSYRSYRS